MYHTITRRDFFKSALSVGALSLGVLSLFPPPSKKHKTGLVLERKMLLMDELPQGALARYERDIAVKSHIIPKRSVI